jgi:hypothetical protein
LKVVRFVLGLALLLTALPAGVAAQTPLPPVQNGDPFFGAVQAVYSPDPAARAGVRWERLVFWWSRMQPNGPGDDLRDSWFSDAQIGQEVARGVTPVGVILSTPAWARRDPGADHNSVPKNLELPADQPDNHWAQFMRKLSAKYRGRIDTWIIWNEPDMYRGNDKRTWSGGVDDYYRLLKGAYWGVRNGNPNGKVFVSGTTYWWDKEEGRRQFVDELLDRVAADPTAPANGYYFDGLSVHSYANPLNSFTIPTVYRNLLRARGIDKPIWIQESNVVPRDDPLGPLPAGGFRATLDEQASFVIESLALARAAAVERASIYKMSDTGGESGELYGLVRDDGTVRPAYLAYQTAATYFSNVQRATYSWDGPQTLEGLLRSNEGRFQFVWPAALNRVVMERPGQRVTVVWNASPQPLTARVTASAGSARLVSKLGAVQTIQPSAGAYELRLEPSANNSDTRDPTLYLVGGSPLILVEDTNAPAPTPAAAVAATPTPAPSTGATPTSGPPPAVGAPQVEARIQIVWPHGNASVRQATRANISAYLFQPGTFVPVACAYPSTVRLWVGLNNEPARPVATATQRSETNRSQTITAFDFNDVDVSAARDSKNKLYFFVTVEGVPSRSTIWAHGADARTYFPAPDVPSGIGAAAPLDARIEIVWPHGDAPVDRASMANVTAMLLGRGTLQSVDPTYQPTVRLHRALDTGPGEMVATGTQRITTRADGLRYPVWDFNDVDVSAARTPLSKLYFWVTVDGVDAASNVWTHGADARTIMPDKNVPTESCR